MKTKNILTDVSLKILMNEKHIQCSAVWLERIKSFALDIKMYSHVSERAIGLGWGELVVLMGVVLLCFVAIFLFYH